MKKMIILLLIVSFLLCGCAKEENRAVGVLSDFSTLDIDSNKVDESILADKKVTMINIWGTYCGPCIQEMPALAAIAEKYEDSDFQIIGLICDVADPKSSSGDTARGIIAQTGVKYRNIVVSDSMNTLMQTVMAVPTTIFVNENGEQIGQPYVGARDQEAWEDIIAEVLKQA
ncbi:MAG: TlpA family protein disulfide reductase [Clostridia bacterium]|nr:TlpA family protein disulfide reductase [Clostridia bacterium]